MPTHRPQIVPLIDGPEENDTPSEIVIEGILESCDANSTHIILAQAIILKVYGEDPYSETARS